MGGRRGGVIIQVANLNNDGPGSFRAACVDERLIREYQDGTGKLVYNVEDVGGFTVIAVGTPYVDTVATACLMDGRRPAG